MLTVNFKNIFDLQGEGISKNDWSATGARLPEFLERVEKREQGFYKVIDDVGVVKNITAFAKKVRGQFKFVVVLGIGGSSLGALCLEQSLKHLFDHELPKRQTPKLFVLDNIDPTLMREVEDVIKLKQTLFIVVTKSGGTPETLSQYFYFRKKIESLRAPVTKHFVFVTDPKVGMLRKIANEEKITTFEVPPSVGGRFSVLTAVGLLPAAMIGIDIKKLLMGAQLMRDKFLDVDFEHNLAFQLASAQYLLAKKGKTIQVLMPYAQKLIRLADWYRQLLAESIGKAKNNRGETVHVGITPINALGVTDQHSQSQLYNEGPNDKTFMFIRVQNLGKLMQISLPNNLDSAVDFLKGVSFNELISVECDGTIGALTKNSRPNLSISIDKVDAQHLGEFLMLFEGAVAFLGEWFEVNAFDQPGVELSKQLTKQMLLAKK